MIKENLKKLLFPIYNFTLSQISKVKIHHVLNSCSVINLEVGAGSAKGKDGWTTLDINRRCDIYWDLRNGIPFPDKSVDKIYSSHFLEHLTFSEGQSFLNECLRVLKPLGIFSICVPDARLFINAYLHNSSEDKKLLGYSPAVNQTTSIDYINYIAYMDGHHKYLFDQDNLLFILKSKGFQDVRSRKFDINLDKKERVSTSIYAEAVKPKDILILK